MHLSSDLGQATGLLWALQVGVINTCVAGWPVGWKDIIDKRPPNAHGKSVQCSARHWWYKIIRCDSCLEFSVFSIALISKASLLPLRSQSSYFHHTFATTEAQRYVVICLDHIKQILNTETVVLTHNDNSKCGKTDLPLLRSTTDYKFLRPPQIGWRMVKVNNWNTRRRDTIRFLGPEYKDPQETVPV